VDTSLDACTVGVCGFDCCAGEDGGTGAAVAGVEAEEAAGLLAGSTLVDRVEVSGELEGESCELGA